MPHTALRRTAVVGLGALGALAVAAPASALTLDPTVASPVTTVTTDPLVPPPPPLPGPLDQVVKEAVATVEGLLAPPPPPPPTKGAEPSSGSGDPAVVDDPPADTGAPAAGQPPAGAEDPAAAPGATDPVAPAAQATAATQTALTSPAAGPPAAAATNGNTGVGTAGLGGSIVALDREGALLAASGFASDPMSLFGAPLVAPALPPLVEAPTPAPQLFTPAGAQVALLPVGGPDSVPGHLAALACALVAVAAAGHVRALRDLADARPA